MNLGALPIAQMHKCLPFLGQFWPLRQHLAVILLVIVVAAAASAVQAVAWVVQQCDKLRYAKDIPNCVANRRICASPRCTSKGWLIRQFIAGGR